MRTLRAPVLHQLRVQDYGKGIFPETTGRSHSSRLGVGIAGMRERVRQFGGELTVSRAEPGTLVEPKIPLFNLDAGTL
jgi:signal transduction histidine kinase